MKTIRAQAFTLVELVMAMAITVLVGLSVSGATMVLSASYDQGQAYQEYVQSARSTSMRLQTLLRRARLITSCSGTSLVFWAGDYNANGQINASELIRISYDPATKELHEYQIDLSKLSALTAATLDSLVTLAIAMDEPLVRTLLEVTFKPYLDDRLLAGNVRLVEFRTDFAPPSTRRVSIRLDVGDSEQNLVVQPAVTLRSPSTDKVGIADQQYILIPGVL